MKASLMLDGGGYSTRPPVAETTGSLAALSAHKIEEVEAAFLDRPQVECQVTHRFGPGVYIREVCIPAGTLAIGHHQNFEHMNVMLKGRVSILNENGTVSELVAPLVFVGKPGRKIGYIHEEIVWQNIYGTDETDVEKLEAKYLTKSEAWQASKALESGLKLLGHKSDVDDYHKMLDEFGFRHEVARAQSEDESDQTPMPFGSYKIKIGDSSIEGKGIFATANIGAGEMIGPARLSGKRTPLGRYTNHSKSPNARMVKEGDDIYLVASSPIAGCRGGGDGEEITIDYRQTLRLSAHPIEA